MLWFSLASCVLGTPVWSTVVVNVRYIWDTTEGKCQTKNRIGREAYHRVSERTKRKKTASVDPTLSRTCDRVAFVILSYHYQSQNQKASRYESGALQRQQKITVRGLGHSLLALAQNTVDYSLETLKVTWLAWSKLWKGLSRYMEAIVAI